MGIGNSWTNEIMSCRRKSTISLNFIIISQQLKTRTKRLPLLKYHFQEYRRRKTLLLFSRWHAWSMAFGPFLGGEIGKVRQPHFPGHLALLVLLVVGVNHQNTLLEDCLSAGILLRVGIRLVVLRLEDEEILF